MAPSKRPYHHSLPARLPTYEAYMVMEGDDTTEPTLNVGRREMRGMASMSWEEYSRGIKLLADSTLPMQQSGSEPLVLSPALAQLQDEQAQEGLWSRTLAETCYRRLVAADSVQWLDGRGSYNLPLLQTMQKLMLKDAVKYEALGDLDPPVASYSSPVPDPRADDDYVWHMGYDVAEAGDTGRVIRGRLRMKLPVPLLPAPPPLSDDN